MAAIQACTFSTDLSLISRRDTLSASRKLKRNPILKPFAVLTEHPSTGTATTRRSFVEEKKSSSGSDGDAAETRRRLDVAVSEEGEYSEEKRKSLKDYLDEAKEIIRSDGSGQPRWFSPIECGSHSPDSPLLLYLPGIDGVGLGLTMHHQRLGEIFEVWCLHIPVKDRTSFTGLVTLIEEKVRSENSRLPKRPIYLVGESLGACFALAVAARNPDIDLVLILANPATSFNKSVWPQIAPLLGLMPDQVTSWSSMLSVNLMTGDPLKMVMDNVVKGISLQSTVEELSQNLIGISSYLPVVADILPKETLLWKAELLKSAAAYANARLHAVKAQTLILCSGKDQLLPSQEEGQRLRRALPNCLTRKFEDSGHFLFMEDGVDLVTIIKGASFYRRGNSLDYVSDFMPLTITEFNNASKDFRWFKNVTSPVMFSTLEDGRIVRGLSGIPSEGPTLLVGYHMLLGLDIISLVPQFLLEKNIHVRGIAHPTMFYILREQGGLDLENFDRNLRLFGAVPVSATNFYKLLSSKSHMLLYPGGVREGCHRKGEEYKLFWPEQSEFVKMAARFGAKIIPFGAVGEDDVAQLVFDYNDQMKIPFLRSLIEQTTANNINLRADASGEVANQQLHFPVALPKVPGRIYYYFGKPIETEGRKHELRDKKKSHELYLQVKSEVENYLAYLKEKREDDPYRNLMPRLLYQATHGFTAEVPTFEI